MSSGAVIFDCRGQRRCGRKRRRKWARERTEKRHDLRDLGVRQRDAELDSSHHPHRPVERRDGPIVEVRRRHLYVPETRNLEHVEVCRGLSDLETAFVDFWAGGGVPVLFLNSELLKHLTSHSYPVVAGSTASLDEAPHAASSDRRDSPGISARI